MKKIFWLAFFAASFAFAQQPAPVAKPARPIPAIEHVVVIGIDGLRPDRLLLAGKPSSFREDQLRMLVAIGRQAALAVENYRYQQAIVKAERLAAMGQTIATLSHHIKNILQGIRGGSYLIEMGLKEHDDSIVGKGWNIVEKNQAKIYDLVLDMLSYSKEREPVLEQTDLNGIVRGFGLLLKDDGVVIVEVPYVGDMIDHTEFDTIYHEHLCYFSLSALDHIEDQGAVLNERGLFLRV